MDFASPDILRDASSAKLTTACTAEHLPSQTGFIPLAWPLAQVLIGRVFSFFHCKRDHLRLGVTDKASRNGEWKPNALWGPLASPRFLSKIFLQPLSPPPTPTPSTNTHPAPFKDQPFCREREKGWAKPEPLVSQTGNAISLSREDRESQEDLSWLLPELIHPGLSYRGDHHLPK